MAAWLHLLKESVYATTFGKTSLHSYVSTIDLAASFTESSELPVPGSWERAWQAQASLNGVSWPSCCAYIWTSMPNRGVQHLQMFKRLCCNALPALQQLPVLLVPKRSWLH